MVSCEIKGNEKILNAGIVSINADLLISHCKFSGFKSGGVILQSTYQNTVKIADCQISKLGVVGIYCQGEDARPLVLRTKIDQIDGLGIKIHKANRAKIKGCEISKCTNGIEVDCGDPLVIMNKIFKCYENGIVTIAKRGILCNGHFKFNSVH